MSSGRSTTTHRVATALRERRPQNNPPRNNPSQDNPSQDNRPQDNPFAPPAEDAPEQPWQPRRPEDSSGPEDERPAPPPPPAWGGQWSDQQPSRQSGGLGGGPRPGPDSGPGSGGNGAGGPSGPRFDPTDPAQRRGRYALLSGMWGLFFALLGWTPLSLLLGALALYWGISALRMKPEQRADARAAAAAALSRAPVHDEDPRPQVPSGELTEKPQRTAAISGIVAGSLAMLLVAATYTIHFVYQDYYSCTRDALTSSSRAACADLLPTPLRSVIDNG
jgi:hypothetical protein